MKNIFITLCAIGVLIGCSGEKPFDVSYVNDGFQGITFMDENGEYNGPIDQSDWKFYSGSSQFLKTSINQSIINPQSNSKNQNSFAKIIPSDYRLNPAYPNPTTGNFRVSFHSPTYADFIVTVVDKEYNIMLQDTVVADAGIHQYYIFPELFNTYYEPEGIYRVYIDIAGTIYGYGDVQIIYEPDIITYY